MGCDVEVFDNPDRCSVDIFVLRSAESGQMDYGVYDKYLMIKNVSFANGVAQVSFKDTIRKGCSFTYTVLKTQKVDAATGNATLTTTPIAADFTGMADVMIKFHPIDRA